MDQSKRYAIKNSLFVILLGLVPCLAPFFRGLYFQLEMYAFIIYIMLIALLYLKTVEKNIPGLLEYTSLIFIIVYILTLFYAYNINQAIFESVKNISYWILFVILANTLKRRLDFMIIHWMLIASGVIICIIAFGSGFGTFEYQGAVKNHILSSTFQYHNTFGAYMLGLLFILSGQIAQADNWKKSLYTGLGYLFFISFIFSFSRGSWVIFPIIGLVAFLIYSEEGLRKVCISFIGIIIVTIFTYTHISTGILEKNQSEGWIGVIIGFFFSVGIDYVVTRFMNKYIKVKMNRIGILIGSIILAAVIFMLLVYSPLGHYIPERFWDRLTSINLKATSLMQRGVFYKDAMKIVSDHLFLGTGGGGWGTLYNQYKTYDYTSSQVHSYPIQVLVETGIIGFATLISVYFSIFFICYKIIRRKNAKNHDEAAAIMCAALGLILHSFIDFDMALGSYSLLMWSLLGSLNAMYKASQYPTKKQKSKSKKYISLTIGMFSIGILIFSAWFLIANHYLKEGAVLGENHNYEEAESMFRKAVSLKPYDAKIHLNLAKAQYMAYQTNGDRALLKAAKKSCNEAVHLMPYDSLVLRNAAKLYYSIGNMNGVLEVTDNMLKYNPIQDVTYDAAIFFYKAVSQYYLLQGDENGRRKALQAIDRTMMNINELNNKLKIKKKEIWGDDTPQYMEDLFEIKLKEDTLKIVDEEDGIAGAVAQ